MGFNFSCVDKVEADDVIATLATYADKQNIKTLIARLNRTALAT
jgi:5'-3' exonuclease